jgi:hypothetical protein
MGVRSETRPPRGERLRLAAFLAALAAAVFAFGALVLPRTAAVGPESVSPAAGSSPALLAARRANADECERGRGWHPYPGSELYRHT